MKECPACRRCFPDHFNNCPSDGDALLHSIQGEPMLDGRYQLEQRLGQGGMGVVFKARHLFLKTAHAIKVILPDLVGNDPMLVTRFRQEAMAAAAIRHPNIIAVTDFGVARGTMPFLVMEFVQGKSLHDLLERERKLSPAQALDVMAGIAAGVGAAHRHGIVHRDLKPLNIMLQDGMPTTESIKVLDFGLAKIKSGELLGSFVAAQTTGLMGSPFYMAPEQWSEEEPDKRADVYSLGVILYQMLAGDVPFKGPSIPAIMKKHLMSAPPAFVELGAQVPPAIERVVRRTLEKNPDERPQSVEEFVAELRGAIADSQSDTLANTQLFAPDTPAPTLIELSSQPQMSVPTLEPKRQEMEAARLAEEQAAEAARLRAAQEERERSETEERQRAEAAEAAKRQKQLDEQQRLQREQEEAQQAAVERARQEAKLRQQEEEAARLQAEEIERQREAAEAARQQREREIAAANARAAEEKRRREEYEQQQREAERQRLLTEQRAREEAEQQRAREERERRERAERERAELAARMASTPIAPHAPGTQTGQYGQPQGTLPPQNLGSNTAPTLMPDSFPPPSQQGGQTGGWPNMQQPTLQNSQPPVQTSQPHFQSSQPPFNQSLHSFGNVSAGTITAPKKSRTGLIVGVITLLALMMIGSAVAYYIFVVRPGEVDVNDPPLNTSPTPNPSPSPSASTTPRAADMVAISGGTFQMGRTGGSELETPAHPVTVAPFMIDRTEVTNAEYAEFVQATSHRSPLGWSGTNPPAGQEQWPVNNVSYDDAVAFARWRSQRDRVRYRLPTEAEWEFAARGTQNNLYPWGNTWEETRVNLGTGAGRATDFPKPVGSYPTGATPTGVLDMIGNVWEWTSSSATLYPGNRQELSDIARGRMVARGGSHQSLHPESVASRGSRPFHATQRAFYPQETRDSTVGFRLVRPGS